MHMVIFPRKFYQVCLVFSVVSGCVYLMLHLPFYPSWPPFPSPAFLQPNPQQSRPGEVTAVAQAVTHKPEVVKTTAAPPAIRWKSAASELVPLVRVVEKGSEEAKRLELKRVEVGGFEPKPRFQTQTSDRWPVFSKEYFPTRIPPSPFHSDVIIHWDFNTTAFLQRPDVRGQPPKLMTWMVKPRYVPPLPEPVRLRVCPEMPCRMVTDRAFAENSSALLWNGQIMMDPAPPPRSHPDQVFVFHNNEPQLRSWIQVPSFRKAAWKSAFNWTMDNRFDSDLVSLFGYLARRDRPPARNYTDILSHKTGLAAWMVSMMNVESRRQDYVKQLQQHMQVDVFGERVAHKCPRGQDDKCLAMISKKYKFYLGFENGFCKDYVSEKFFKYFSSDVVVVARGSNEYKNHAPQGTFINTADFKSPKELADHLLYLDKHPEEYLKLLKAKDEYWSVTEDWPTRTKDGRVTYVEHHFESIPLCEMCRRLWDLDKYRKTVPDIVKWFDSGNCYAAPDLK